jgi:glycosyltransferase A (GT-A) superfamily protein (DUF2064 family)
MAIEQEAAMTKNPPIGIGMERHLNALGETGRAKLQRETVKSLQRAWRARHDSGRASHVIHANVRMLRNLRTLQS